MENKLIQGKIKRIKQDITGITKRKSEQVYRDISQRDNRSNRSGNLSNSKVSNLDYAMSNTKNHIQPHLPAIFKVEKYFVNKETDKIKIKSNTNSNTNPIVKKNNMHNFTVDVNIKI